MKTGKERKGKRVEPPTNCYGSTGSIGVNKSTKRNSAQGCKATGIFCVKLPFRVSFYSLLYKSPIWFI